MKIVHKVALFAVLLVSGLQISAKNKDRIFVINNFGKDILVKAFNHVVKEGDDKTIKKGASACIAVSNFYKIQVYDKAVWMKGVYYAEKEVQADNVILITKKSKFTPRIQVYKNYDDFMAANPDYQLDAAASCPHVLPAA